jgi:hypothetical protein
MAPCMAPFYVLCGSQKISATQVGSRTIAPRRADCPSPFAPRPFAPRTIAPLPFAPLQIAPALAICASCQLPLYQLPLCQLPHRRLALALIPCSQLPLDSPIAPRRLPLSNCPYLAKYPNMLMLATLVYFRH